ncbi:EAL domain-containing protein [Neptuniibacter sp.]|uniref:EAL domain-containing protein n=1 Tax=Neptuniibacter sp. TaxID=1962643 RepID=UPI002612973B|nr:EAL domain-containing protein [Neptuniibacter sp.]MCP4596994.1 EAL domain-containing protein [Neptuniibacter sp.]
MKQGVSNSVFLQAGLVVALCALLLFFFRVNTQHSDLHSERVSSLLIADELDAQLDLIALQILTANMQQYDSLVGLYDQFTNLRIGLGSKEGEGFVGVPSDVAEDSAELLNNLQIKLELIERLKTQSASVRNGLLYLPTLSAELDQHPFRYLVHPREFVTWLMSYSHLGSDSSREELVGKMDLVQRWLNNHPDDLLFKNFSQHLTFSLNNQKRLSALKATYLSVPSKEALGELRSSYLAFHASEVARIKTMSIQLLLLCVALVGYLIFILRRLDKARVEAEEASNLLHDAVERLSEGFALYANDGTLRLTNSRWLELYGLTDIRKYPATLDELEHRSSEFIFESFCHEDDKTGQQFTLQKTTNGAWLQATDTKTSDGGLVCVRVDITDYKEAELQLRQLGSAVEQSPASIVITNIDGTIEYINPKFEQVTGYSFEEAVGQNPKILKSGYSSEKEYASMWQELLSGKEWRGTFYNQKKDGTNYWESASISPIKDSHGQITHFVAVKEDITQQKKANDDLKMAAAVFEATQEGIMITDPDLNITAVNPAFTTITGYSEYDVLGKSPAILSSGKHGADFYQKMWEELWSEGCWSSEVWNKKKDGTLYPQWLSISVVHDDEGKAAQYIGVLSDMSERKAHEEQIHYQAYYDGLTGLPNRTLLMDRIEHDITVSKRSGHLSSLLFVDLDRFKRVNDTMGHEVGDRLLVEVAERLKSVVRESDTISRFGGDEFVILLTDIPSAESAAVVAEKVINALGQPFDLNGYEVFSGASVGITMTPTDSDVPVELLRLADLAMYKAKESGRNQFHFFARKMQERVNRRVVLEHMLRKGLEEGELEVFYQPIIDAKTHKIFGVEALLRWFQPEEGNISPYEFIPVAEESGLIAPLGEMVLMRACQDIQEIHQIGRKFHLSVNVSSQQYRLGFDAGKIAGILELSGFSGDYLSLELTESLLFDGDRDIMAWLKAIKDLQVKLSIDDFGTGYSSLSYLKRFPIDILKIDRAFVADLDGSGDASSLVNAIISMAESLNLDVIAEGVETGNQLDIIAQLGCDYVQGYFYAKPMAKEDLISWIEHHEQMYPQSDSDELLLPEYVI